MKVVKPRTKVKTRYTVELSEELATLLQQEAAKHQAWEDSDTTSRLRTEWNPERMIISILANKLREGGHS